MNDNQICVDKSVLTEPLQKPWYQSKVLWFNALAVTSIVITNFLPNVTPAQGQQLNEYASLLITLINGLLRIFSTKTELVSSQSKVI